MRKSRSNLVILKSSVGSPPAMALVNELKKKRVKVIGIDADPLSAGLYLCDKGYVVHKVYHPKFLSEVLRICDIEKPNLMLPGPEMGTLLISKNKELFAKRGVLVLCPDYKITKICVDKWETHRKLQSLGIPVPKIFTKNTARFPCVIKPRSGSGAIGVFIVNDKTEMNVQITKVKNPIIQEFIPGTEYSVDVFSDLDGIPLSIVPRIRIQTESGVSIKGITAYDKTIIDYCDKISREMRLIGPSCIQCIKNDDGVKFLEVNLRFGGGSILSLKANPSILSNLVKIARGQKPRPFRNFKKGLTMLRYYSEVFVPKGRILKADSV